MGLFSSKKTITTTNKSYDQSDRSTWSYADSSRQDTRNYNLQDLRADYINFIPGSYNTMTDFGAVQSSQDFARAAMHASLDASQSVYGDSLGLVRDALTDMATTRAQSYDLVLETQKPSGERTTDNMIRYAGIGLILFIGVQFFKR